jgi:uncharacterized surface protein with fasciclin (FAS1) repeats
LGYPIQKLRINSIEENLFMISRRFRNVAILLAILALVLAACGPQATPTAAPTDEPTPTEEAVEATEETVVEATAEVVEETEEAVVEEATEEAVVEATEVATEATEEAVVEEPTEEAVVEATEVATEEAVVEATEVATEATEEAVEATEVAPEATEAPVTTETFNDAGFTFSHPSNYTVDAGNGLYRVSNGDLVVVVINNTAYTTVLGGETFADDAAALAFYLDRTGYEVGEATADGVAVSLPRRNQVGSASLVDLGAGNSAVVIALGPDADNQPTDVATQIRETVSIPTILGTALTTEGLGTVATALVRGGLASTFNAEGAYTVFAPSDDAFAAALEAMGMTADDLLADRDLLESVLNYHVVEGVLNLEDLTDGLEMTTLNGAVLTVAIDEEGTLTINDVAGNSYTISTPDVAASNGVVHVIDGVLSPVPAPEPEATPEVTPEATAEATQGS